MEMRESVRCANFGHDISSNNLIYLWEEKAILPDVPPLDPSKQSTTNNIKENGNWKFVQDKPPCRTDCSESCKSPCNFVIGARRALLQLWGGVHLRL